MSDDLTDPADVPVETAQDAVEPTEPNSEVPAPWGDDFNPDRAWNTITHLRGREKELEQQAKQFDRLRNDPDAFREFVSDMGYELPEEEEPEAEYTPEPTEFKDPRVDQILAERDTERLNSRILEQGAQDVDAIQKDVGRDLTEDEIRHLSSLALPDENGIPRVLLAYEQIKAYNELQKPVATPARTPIAGGQGSEKFDIRNPEHRQARLAAAMEAEAAGS